MAVNKVIYGNNTLIDITGDTATASDVLSGKTLHTADGTQATGSLVVQNYYTGSSAPSSSLGNDGDLYLQS